MGRNFDYRIISDSSQKLWNESVMCKDEFKFVCVELRHLTKFKVLKTCDKLSESVEKVESTKNLTAVEKNNLIRDIATRHEEQIQMLWDDYHKQIATLTENYKNQKVVVKYHI